jgi:nitrogen fixation NifU-like protein
MNAELRDLYQDLILDHGKKPRNFREMPEATGHAEGFNPLCGDHCTVYAKTVNDELQDVSFLGKGCAISQASASLMTQASKGKSRADVQHMFDLVQKMVKDTATEADLSELGKLVVLAGVKEFPSRVKCATLPWHTLIAALNNEQTPVSTE